MDRSQATASTAPEFELQEGVVVIADRLGLAALERVGERLLVALEDVERRRVDLRHDGLALEVGQAVDAAVLLHDDDLLVEHVGLGEGVVVFAALDGEAVPDAVDLAAAEQRVFRIPVDRLGLVVPAVAVGDLLGQVKVEARVLAVVADETIGRVGWNRSRR